MPYVVSSSLRDHAAFLRDCDAGADVLDEPVFKCIDGLPLHLAGDVDVLLDLHAGEREQIKGVLLVVVCGALIGHSRIALGDRRVARHRKALRHAGLCGIVVHRRHRLHEARRCGSA